MVIGAETRFQSVDEPMRGEKVNTTSEDLSKEELEYKRGISSEWTRCAGEAFSRGEMWQWL